MEGRTVESLTDLPKTFIVLGVHRSGTSFVTKCLIDAGVEMGGQAIHYEDNAFVQLNMKIIQAAGGIWRNPPDPDALRIIGAEHADRIQRAIAAKSGDLRGWKDPRQALTMESYLPYLDGDVYLVAMFRKPEKVGASLKRIGQMDAQRGTAMAREYDRRIVRAIQSFVGIEGGS